MKQQQKLTQILNTSILCLLLYFKILISLTKPSRGIQEKTQYFRNTDMAEK